MKQPIVRYAVWAVMSASLMPFAAQADEFTDALASTYESNPRIKAQRKALETTNEKVSQAIGNWRPNVNTSYGRGRQRTRFDTNSWSYDEYETKQLSVSQPIFNGGGNFSRYASSKAIMMANRAELERLQQEVLLDAIEAYFGVVRAQEILEISEKNESVLGRQLAAAQDRFSVGDVTRTDVAQSRARRSQAESELIRSRGDLEQAIANFERVVGYRPEGLLPIPQDLPPIPATLDEAIDRAMQNSPVIQSIEFRAESAEDDVFTNISSMLPQVSLDGTMSRQTGAGVTGRSQYDTDRVTLNVSLPLYQRGNEYSRVREAKLLAKQREHQQRDAEDAVRESTIKAWETLQTSVASIAYSEDRLEASQIALSGVREEHQYGARTVLDVLDAEQENFTSQVNLARAKYNRWVSVYSLLYNLGDLTLPNLEVDAPQYNPEEHYDDVKWQLLGF